MSECCGNSQANQEQCCQKEFLDWLWKRDRKYTTEEIKDLVERVKVFNAGCIDEYLTRHVDKVFEEWAKNLN